MSNLRAERIREVFKEEVGSMLQREIKDPRIGFVTVTDVEISGDLRHAKIYVSPFGPDTATERATMEGLESAKGYIRTELGRRVRLRYTPEISFIIDKSIERGVRLTRLIDEVGEKGEAPR